MVPCAHHFMWFWIRSRVKNFFPQRSQANLFLLWRTEWLRSCRSELKARPQTSHTTDFASWLWILRKISEVENSENFSLNTRTNLELPASFTIRCFFKTCPPRWRVVLYFFPHSKHEICFCWAIPCLFATCFRSWRSVLVTKSHFKHFTRPGKCTRMWFRKSGLL